MDLLYAPFTKVPSWNPDREELGMFHHDRRQGGDAGLGRRLLHVLTLGSVALGGAVGLLTQNAVTAQAETSSIVLSDNFDRTSQGGWGSVDGKSYKATFGASRLSVESGRGLARLNPSSAIQATLNDVQMTDGATQLTYSPSRIAASGNGLYVGPMLRIGSSGAYRLSARTAPSGRLTIALERLGADGSVSVLRTSQNLPAVKADQPLTLRLEARGTQEVSLRGSAWTSGKASAAPSISFSDSTSGRIARAGGVAAWAYLSGSSQATVASFTSFTATRFVAEAVDPTPVPAPSPAPATGSSDAAGSLPVGKANYAVPDGAVFVARTGSDQADGKKTTPYKTIAKAVNSAGAGSTIVVRGGSYHESLMITKGKRLTIQAYPGEAVWLDGSSEITGFTRSGSAWVKNGWNVQFDSSPTFARGKPDGTTPGWQFLNADHPMAAHPDQVWIGGEVQTQVGSLSKVKPGTFYVDYGQDRLYLGTDPTGEVVRASDLQIALTLLSADSGLKGIGIRRYAPSVPDMGAVLLWGADGSVLENVVISESATNGLTMGLAKTSDPVRLTHVTASDNGLMGIGANRMNGLVVDHVLVARNNREHFNPAPSAGGFKLSRSLSVTVKDSRFVDNDGTGLWFDESSVALTVTRNDASGNSRFGIVVELSARARLVNNVMSDNTQGGLIVLDSNKVDVWNNSIRGGFLPVRIADGRRVSTDKGDPAQTGNMSAEATWITKDIVVRNNVVGDATPSSNGSAWCGLLCVLDDRRISTASQMNASVNGNLYYRSKAGTPSFTVRWAGGTAGALSFSNLTSFKSATGQETKGAEVTGTSLVTDDGILRSANGTYSNVGVAIPSDIANLGGLPTGSNVLGARR